MKSLVLTLLALCLALPLRAGELQDAAEAGDLAKVQSLLKANPTALNARAGGTTALHEAARAGHLEIVKLLIGAGAHVNATDFSGLTPLRLAISKQHADVAAFLKSSGGLEKVTTAPPAVIASSQPKPSTPLFNSAPTPVPPAVGSTSPAAPAPVAPPAAPAIANKPLTEQDLMPAMFPIHEAARIGDVERIKLLFKSTPDIVDATDEKGLTPLHVAALNHQYAVAQTLIALRAKVSPRNNTGQTPLHTAIKSRDVAIAGLLLTNKALVNARDNLDNTPLLLVLMPTDSAEVPGDVSLAVSKQGRHTSGTNWAASVGKPIFELARILVANHADLTVRNRAGATALTEAVRIGSEPVVSLLLNAGADPNAAEFPGKISPLHLAVAHGDASILQSLLQHHATVDAADERGDTPLCYALRENRTALISLLKQAGGTTGQMRPLSSGEKSLVDSYERTETILRQGSASEKSRALIAMNPSKTDVERMFPKHASAAWKVVDQLNEQIRQAFSRPVRDADERREIWRIRPDQPNLGVQEWRARGWIAPDLTMFSLTVDKTGGTTRPGDYCFVNNHWVLVPPLGSINAQAAAMQSARGK